MGLFSSIAGIAGGVLSLVGGKKQSRAATEAARLQAAADQAAIDESRRQFDVSTALTQNQRDLQDDAGSLLRSLLIDGDASAFQTSPGFEFARDENLRAVEGSAFARNQGLSGRTVAALGERATGLANQEFGSAINRLLNLNAGGGASLNLAGLGQQNAQVVGGLLQDQGQNRASGVIGRNNANQNQLSSIVDLIQGVGGLLDR